MSGAMATNRSSARTSKPPATSDTSSKKSLRMRIDTSATPSELVSSNRQTSSFSTVRSRQSWLPSSLRSLSHSFSPLFLGSKVLRRNARRSSTDCRPMEGVIQSRWPRMSNSEFFCRFVRVRYTRPRSSMDIATGSGASESEAHRSNRSPSASFTGILSRIALAYRRPWVGSSRTTSGVLTVRVGRLIFMQETTTMARSASSRIGR